MRLSCVSNDAASAVWTRALASKYAMRPIALHESPMLPCLLQQGQYSLRFWDGWSMFATIAEALDKSAD